MTPMTTLRSRVLLVLPLLLTVACTAVPPARQAGAVVHGSIGSGGSAQGSRSDGTRWALRLVGSDVLLGIDGAEVRFVEGAPQGRLDYERVKATATWRLQLAGGVALWQGHDLEYRGRRYRLLDGVDYSFDREGSLESEQER